MLKHPIFKKILRILFGSGLLLAIGFSMYGIYEWNMTRTIKTTGLFCITEEADDLDYLQTRMGNLYKIEENKRYGIKKISIRRGDAWDYIVFNAGVESITLGKNKFGDTYFKPQKGSVGWNMSFYSIIDRTTLIKKRYDADGNFVEGSEQQCEIQNRMIKEVEERTKDREEAKRKEIKEIIENRKI